MWGLIWVQIVYKDYQQKSLVCKGFKCLLEVCLFEPYYSSYLYNISSDLIFHLTMKTFVLQDFDAQTSNGHIYDFQISYLIL